jgi:hypothetical protein
MPGLGSTVALAVCALLATACANAHEPRDSRLADEAGPAVAVPGGAGDRRQDAALFLVENEAESELAVMRNGERLTELPAFASWPGYERAGVTALIASAEYAVVSHMATRDYDPRGIIANADPGMQPQTSTVHRTMLVRRSDWQVLWQRTSEWLSDAALPKLAADGRVVLVERPFETYPQNAIVVKPDGEEVPVRYSTPLSAPDSDGWMAVSTPGYGRTIYGFSRAGEQDGVRPLGERLQGDGADEQYYDLHPHVRADGTFEYISEAAGSAELALVTEGPSSRARIPLGRSPDGQASFIRAGHSRLVLSVTASNGRARPWLRVDRDGAVHAVPVEVQDKEFPSGGGVANDWIAFRDGSNPYATTGWLNADTGAVKLAPVPPAGMQSFGQDHCSTSPALREDGRALIGLRDDAIGGVFLEDGDGGFTRVGLPVRDALHVEILQVGETLQLSGISHQYRYCVAPIWTGSEPEGPVLRGGQTELLRAGRSLVVDGGHGFGVPLDRSGRYAPVSNDGRTVLHDLELGTAHELPAGVHIVAWFGSDREASAE